MVPPNFDEYGVRDDIHIGDVRPSSDLSGDATEGRWDQLASMAHPSSAGGTSKSNGGGGRRGGRFDRGEREEDDNDDLQLCDPTVAHVRAGSICLPVEMMLPPTAGTDQRELEKMGGGSEGGDGNGIDATRQGAPSYRMTAQSRVSLHAAFPPPHITVRPSDDINGPMYDESKLLRARKRLERNSGFHGALGVAAATSHTTGYSDTIMSFNYRNPFLLSLPRFMSSRQQKWIGTQHCDVHLGAAPTFSVGSTLSSLDGGAHLSWDAGNPFSLLLGAPDCGKKSAIVAPSTWSGCAISASRDFHSTSAPVRVDGRVDLAPSPPPVFLPADQCSATSSTSLRLRHLNLTISTIGVNDKACGRRINAKRLHGEMSNCPRLLLNFACGVPITGGEGLHRISRVVKNAGLRKCCGAALWDSAINRSVRERTNSSASPPFSTYLNFEAEHHLSESRLCRSSIEYHNAGQVMSLATMVTRTFASSRFSRLGFGMRQSFGNIFGNGDCWWGPTWWLFQLERGSVHFVIPVSICPRSVTFRDSLVRLLHASLVTIVVDVLVGELLCGVTSKIRLSLLRLLLGEEKVRKFISSTDVSSKLRDVNRLQHHLYRARENAARQVKLMVRQANAIKKKEEGQGGLVIVKAVYGVMDNESRQWLRCDAERSTENNANADVKLVWHVIDATTQCQFWVMDSSLHLPAESKKHMLGFYDLLSYVSEDEWLVERTQSSTIFTLGKWWKKPWRRQIEKRKDLVVVLSVRYKWDGKIYDAIYHDDEAVDLPSRFARVVNLTEPSSK